ncbi:MAG TPA: acylphosphatase [Gemmatimonadota bacterium]|nr:acylphosphatase [Gemmatimonadota bacterium]
MKARRVVVHGRVQGVGFRWFVVRNAEALGVGGTVRNRPDGAVEAILGSADEANVEALVRRIRQGPPGARVERVEDDPVDGPEGERGTTMKVIR